MKHPIDLIYLMTIYSNDQKTMYNSLICSQRISGYVKRWKRVEVVNLLTKFKIYRTGDKYRYFNGKYHREGDKPAVIWSDGTKHWYKNGKCHRECDLPARIWPDGTKEWWLNGKYHREGDKPAVIWCDGTKSWYFNGEEYTPST